MAYFFHAIEKEASFKDSVEAKSLKLTDLSKRKAKKLVPLVVILGKLHFHYLYAN